MPKYKYIDKSALEAEIKKRKTEAELNCGGYKSYDEHRCDDCTVGFYEEFLEILDTLEVKEVKEVDLEEEKRIAKYLYEKKGYPIDLNGNIPSFEETMKDAEQYVRYKKDKFIDMACKWLKENGGSYWMDDYDLPVDKLVNDFRNYMKGDKL